MDILNSAVMSNAKEEKKNYKKTFMEAHTKLTKREKNLNTCENHSSVHF